MDFKGLFSIHGLFKIFELVLVVVTFLLARIGYGGNPALFGITVDEIWLGYLTVGGWLIITPAIIVGILLEEPMSWKLDSLFSIVGAFLYIASGSCAIDYNTNQTVETLKPLRDSGLALGSFCIITGMVLLMDAAFLVSKYARRLK